MIDYKQVCITLGDTLDPRQLDQLVPHCSYHSHHCVLFLEVKILDTHRIVISVIIDGLEGLQSTLTAMEGGNANRLSGTIFAL